MDVAPKTTTAPLTQAASKYEMPPAMLNWVAQFPPEIQALFKQNYREGVARGMIPPGETDPSKLLEVGAKLTGDFTKAMAEAEKLREEVFKALERARELMRELGDQDAVHQMLGGLSQKDMQLAMDRAKAANFQIDTINFQNMSQAQSVAAGLVSVIAAPVASHSQLEGATDPGKGQRASLTDAKGDERMASFDALNHMKSMASQLKLEDF